MMNNRYFIDINSLKKELSFQDNPLNSFHLERFLDEYGFLLENSLNSNLIDLNKLKSLHLAIIVAEAGMGKSYIMEYFKNSFPKETIIFIEPILFLNDILGFEQALISNKNTQIILIDGLDENPSIIPLLIRKLPSLSSKYQIILSSRIIKEIKSLQEKLNLPLYALLPFSQKMIIQLSQQEDINGKEFLDCIKQKGLSSFCAKPLGYKLLLELFKNGNLNTTDSDQLWEISIKNLCKENYSINHDLKPETNIITKESCFDFAAKIAVILKLSGKAIIQRISAVTDNENIDFSCFFKSEEHATFNAILSRPIFTPIGNNCFRFSHKAFFDYMAAIGLQKYISTQNLESIVLSSDYTNIYPQWEETVAWFATRNNIWIELLLNKQPELLLYSDTLIKSIGSIKLCQALLKRANEFCYWDILTSSICQRLHCLNSTELIPILQTSLSNNNNLSEQELAICIIQECQIHDLENELVSLFCNSAEKHSIRLSAGYAIKSFACDESRIKCKTIIEDKNASSDLIGLVIKMTWPNLISIQEIWPHLNKYDAKNIDSLYSWIKIDFPNSLPQLSETKIFKILEWLIDNINLKKEDNITITMYQQILSLCWNKYFSPEHYEIIFKGTFLFRDNYLYPFFEKENTDVPNEICCSSDSFSASVEQRHIFAEGIISLPYINGYELSSIPAPILYRNDIPYIFDKIFSSSDKEIQKKWCQCLNYLQTLIPLPEQSNNWDKIHSLFPDIFLISAKETIILRESAKQKLQLLKENRAHKNLKQQQKLQAIIQDKINLVKQFVSQDNSQDYFSFISDAIIESTPAKSFEYQTSIIWNSLTDIEKCQLITSAKLYLENKEGKTEEHIIYFTSIFALHLLLNHKPESFHSLSSRVIITHGKYLFDCIRIHNNHNLLSSCNQNLLSPLLDTIATLFPNAFKILLITWIKESLANNIFPNLFFVKKHLNFNLYNEIITLCEHSDSPDNFIFYALIEIKKYSQDFVQKFIYNYYSTLSNNITTWGNKLSLFIFYYLPNKVCDLIIVLQTNPQWGQEWLNDIIHVNHDLYPLSQIFCQVPALILADLYIWLHINYPAENEPKYEHAYIPHTIDWIYRFISETFNLIINHPYDNIEPALNKIAIFFPNDYWLNDYIKNARRKDLSRKVKIFTEKEILQLINNKNSIIINSAEDLLSTVTDAINAYQIYLTRTINPRVEDLWNHIDDKIKPKQEEDFSDHLKSYLDIYFKTQKIVINREVQLNRGRNGESGSRTDIWIEAFSTLTKLSLCIEVKGSWNPSAKTAMKDQLIEKYMNNNGADAGILLIGWFQSKSCHQTNIWNNDQCKAREEIEKQEDDAIKSGKLIKGIIIDCDYKI